METYEFYMHRASQVQELLMITSLARFSYETLDMSQSAYIGNKDAEYLDNMLNKLR